MSYMLSLTGEEARGRKKAQWSESFSLLGDKQF
jgi:hypothetical protein